MLSLNMKPLSMAALLLALSVACSHAQSCGNQDDAAHRKQRIQAIRNVIMAQLGPEYYGNETSFNTTAVVVDNATLESFYAISNATMARGNKLRETTDVNSGRYAERIFSFPAVEPQSPGLGKRAAPIPPTAINMLDRFRLHFDFRANFQLKDVTKAELVLYQLPCTASNSCNEKQYVEIRSVGGGEGGTRILGGSYVRLSDSGYQIFDVMEAVAQWMGGLGRGDQVSLEVTTYCFSSLNCNQAVNGTPPTRVHFVNETGNLKTVPRVNLGTRLQQDPHGGSREKRQSGGGVGFCSSGQSLCCLQPLTVNVHTDLKLTYVISPQTININYCNGLCPRSPGGNHLTPQIFFYYSMVTSGPAASLSPCCTGNTYGSITALVADPSTNQPVPVTLDNISVTSCRCA